MPHANNGGPAFPQHVWSNNPSVAARMAKNGGMSLRYWLAGKALEGLLAGRRREEDCVVISREDWAKQALGLADAVIEAGEQ